MLVCIRITLNLSELTIKTSIDSSARWSLEEVSLQMLLGCTGQGILDDIDQECKSHPFLLNNIFRLPSTV